MASDDSQVERVYRCQTCGDQYERRVVGLNGINSCYCGGTLREVRA